MQARVDVLVPYGQADALSTPFMRSVIGWCASTHSSLGSLRHASVDALGAIVFLREHLFELGLDRYRPLGDPTRFLGALVDLFGRAKDEDSRAAVLARHAGRLIAVAADTDTSCGSRAAQVEIATAFERYVQLLAANGYIGPFGPGRSGRPASTDAARRAAPRRPSFRSRARG